MSDDQGRSEVSPGGEPTVALPRPDLASPPPPPPPVDAVDMAELRRSAPVGPSRGGGWVWIAVVVVLTLLFVVACYLVVARAEGDRDDGPSRPPSTTEAATTTAPPTTAAPPPVTQDPATLTVAVLNGTEQAGWAGENAALLEDAGFGTEATDALDSPDVTTVYFASEDLEVDAAAVAEAIGRPDAALAPRPTEPLSESAIDQDADIVVVLGADSVG